MNNRATYYDLHYQCARFEVCREQQQLLFANLLPALADQTTIRQTRVLFVLSDGSRCFEGAKTAGEQTSPNGICATDIAALSVL